MTAGDCIRAIRELADHAALMAFWQRILRNEVIPGWDEGKAFEYLILRTFEIEGAPVRWPYEVRLETDVVEQIDEAVHLAHVSALIEAKDYEQEINIKSLLEMRTKLERRPPAVIGAVFSKRGFTRPATVLARHLAPQRVLLWRGDEVTISFARRSILATLTAKYRRLVEEGLPDYDVSREGVP